MRTSLISAALLVGLVAANNAANGNGWVVRWKNDCSVQCDPAQEIIGATGTRSLEVSCLSDWAEVTSTNGKCQNKNHPYGGSEEESCEVSCYYVDGNNGSTGADGKTASTAFKDVSECIAKQNGQGDAKSSHVVRCIFLEGVYNSYTTANLGGRDKMTFKAADGAKVVFDATDLYTDAEDANNWSSSNGIASISLPSSGTDRPDVIVDGEAIQCAPDYELSQPPCFVYDPSSQSAEVFGHDDAKAFFVDGSTDSFQNLPSFWIDESQKKLYVDVSKLRCSTCYPQVRIRNSNRDDVITMNSYSEYITIEDMNFFGSRGGFALTPSGQAPTNTGFITLRNLHFLYAPTTTWVKTAKGMGREAAEPIDIEGCSWEFGTTGPLYFRANAARVKDNWFAFNGFRNRARYTANNHAKATLYEGNTHLYEGSWGGIFLWAKGSTVRMNLGIGQNYMGQWKDTAFVHVTMASQTDTVISHNWFLGPSEVKSVRLDTSNSATVPGQHATVKYNVAFGMDHMTIKGYEHAVYHNTVDVLNIVNNWGKVYDHNTETFNLNNAASWMYSRDASMANANNGDMPAYSAMNVCQSSDTYNTYHDQTWLTPSSVAAAFDNGARDTSDVFEEMSGGSWHVWSKDKCQGGQTGQCRYLNGKPFNQNHPVEFAATLRRPGIDFIPNWRPKSGGKMDFTSVSGVTCSQGEEPKITGFDSGDSPTCVSGFAGAYHPSDSTPWTPGADQPDPMGLEDIVPQATCVDMQKGALKGKADKTTGIGSACECETHCNETYNQSSKQKIAFSYNKNQTLCKCYGWPRTLSTGNDSLGGNFDVITNSNVFVWQRL